MSACANVRSRANCIAQMELMPAERPPAWMPASAAPSPMVTRIATCGPEAVLASATWCPFLGWRGRMLGRGRVSNQAHRPPYVTRRQDSAPPGIDTRRGWPSPGLRESDPAHQKRRHGGGAMAHRSAETLAINGGPKAVRSLSARKCRRSALGAHRAGRHLRFSEGAIRAAVEKEVVPSPMLSPLQPAAVQGEDVGRAGDEAL